MNDFRSADSPDRSARPDNADGTDADGTDRADGVAETAAAVRSGRCTATAVVEAALMRVTADNPRLNAMASIRSAQASAEAAELDQSPLARTGALAGVPIAVKAECDVAGLVTTYGGRGNSAPASADSEVVRRLRAAGAIIVGTTQMPEFGQFPFTEGSSWGQTRNPWDLTRSPGGSSGGSAAAVAGGLVPAAIGGDGGGSIRIPASACGLVGLKPMRGRVSTAPHPALWGALGTCGPLTRSVYDTALIYDAISGPAPGDRFAAPALSSPLVAAAGEAPARLRVGVLTSPATPAVRLDHEVAAAVETTAGLLASAGHEVVAVAGRWPNADPAFIPQFLAALRECVGLVEHPDRLEGRSRSTSRLGLAITPSLLRRAQDLGERLAERVEDRFAGLDVVLSPTLACLPPPLGRLDGVGSPVALARSLPMVAYTTLANVTGHPAISVPAARSRAGLPIGVQLMTFCHDEAILIRLAGQLEQLNPWPTTAP